MGRVHHSFTPFTSPHRGKRKGGVADNAGVALALKASLSALRVAPSAPSSLHPSSASSLTSLALGSGAGTVISQSLAMILAFHVSQDFMSDESMCSAGPCALPRCEDARGQTLRLGELARKRREHKDEQKTLFRRADGSSFNVGDPDESQTAETKGKKIFGHPECQSNRCFVRFQSIQNIKCSEFAGLRLLIIQI